MSFDFLGGGFYAFSMNEEKKDKFSPPSKNIEKEIKNIKNFIQATRKKFKPKYDELSFGEIGAKFEPEEENKFLSKQSDRLFNEKSTKDLISEIKKEHPEKFENKLEIQNDYLINEKQEKDEFSVLSIDCGKDIKFSPEKENKTNNSQNSPKSKKKELFDNKNVEKNCEDSLFMDEKENLGDQALFFQQKKEYKKTITLCNENSKEQIEKTNNEKNDVGEIEYNENDMDIKKENNIIKKNDNNILIGDILKMEELQKPFSEAPQEINGNIYLKDSPNFKINFYQELKAKPESLNGYPDTKKRNDEKEEEKETIKTNENTIKDISNKGSILSFDKFPKSEGNLEKSEILLFTENYNKSETVLYKSSYHTLKDEDEKGNIFLEESLFHEPSDKMNIDDFFKILETEESQQSINKLSNLQEKNAQIDFCLMENENSMII